MKFFLTTVYAEARSQGLGSGGRGSQPVEEREGIHGHPHAKMRGCDLRVMEGGKKPEMGTTHSGPGTSLVSRDQGDRPRSHHLKCGHVPCQRDAVRLWRVT